MKTRLSIFLFLLSIIFISSCGSNEDKKDGNDKIDIVATTTMVADMIKNIGGDEVNVTGLMGPGVDPHLYKASEGDVTKLANAGMIFYNGLHLEGKMEDILEKIEHRGITVIEVAEVVPKNRLIGSEEYESNYDPHIWFNIDLWQMTVSYAAEKLAEEYPDHAETFKKNATNYRRELEELKKYASSKIAELPEEQRILVTAHDAFSYFGKQYDFEVVGLQGISTSTEAGVKDVQHLADLIYNRKINAIFIETSVPQRNIKALQQAVKSKGYEVKIGGEIYSDALGSPGTEDGTYIGMYKHNVNTIVNALMPKN